MSKNLNPIEITTPAFRFIPALKSIAEYLKLIESLDSKVDRLINTPLNAALESIERAENSKGKNKEEHLRDAVREFKKIKRSENKSIDNVYRLFTIYYGYAMCLYQLNDLKNAREILNEYAKMDLKASWRKQTIVRGRAILLVAPSLVVFSIVWIPIYKLNEIKKIGVIDNSFKKLEELIPYGLKQKESWVIYSQKEAADFAKEIENIISPNFFQKIFSKLFRKKELKLFQKQWKYYFDNINPIFPIKLSNERLYNSIGKD